MAETPLLYLLMDEKKDIKNFSNASQRLKDALNEFESIKKSRFEKSSPSFNEKKAQKEPVVKIKSLIQDLS